MTTGTTVEQTYRTQRDDVDTLADRVGDIERESRLRDQAFYAGNLAERCRARFGSGEVPDGRRAVEQAKRASSLARSADPSRTKDLDEVVAASLRANETLNGTLQTGGGSSNLSATLEVTLDGVDPDQPGSPRSEELDAALARTAVALAITGIALLAVVLARLGTRE